MRSYPVLFWVMSCLTLRRNVGPCRVAFAWRIQENIWPVLLGEIVVDRATFCLTTSASSLWPCDSEMHRCVPVVCMENPRGLQNMAHRFALGFAQPGSASNSMFAYSPPSATAHTSSELYANGSVERMVRCAGCNSLAPLSTSISVADNYRPPCRSSGI